MVHWSEVGRKNFEEPDDQGSCYDIVCPSNIRRSIHKYSTIWLYENVMNKDDSNECNKQDKEKSTSSQLNRNNYRQLIKLEMKDVAFHRREHTNYLSSTKNLVLKTYMQVALDILISLYLLIYMCVHICMQKQLVKKRLWIERKVWSGIWEGLKMGRNICFN